MNPSFQILVAFSKSYRINIW